MPNIPPTRDQLARFLPNQELIRRFEQLFQEAENTTPADVTILFQLAQEIAIDATNAAAAANEALASIQLIAARLGLLPVREDAESVDDLKPAVEVGTIASQNADSVDITGGSASLATATVTTDNGFAITNQTDGAGADTGTLGNAPAATDPDFWAPIQINGANYLIPAWSAP